MSVSRQQDGIERGPRARTRKLMLETASRLMQSGATPSVSDVADAAEVSRATAYRYFPSQSALVEAVVDEALGPILDWSSSETDVRLRVADLLETSLPRINAFEATFRAALKLSLGQWAEKQSGSAELKPSFKRGHRLVLLNEALKPLRDEIPEDEVDQLCQALSLVFGIEPLLVLKDIGGLLPKEAEAIIQSTARALLDAAIANQPKSVG